MALKLVIPRGAVVRSKYTCLDDTCRVANVALAAPVAGARLGDIAVAAIDACLDDIAAVASVERPVERKRALLDALLAQHRLLSVLARLVGWSDWLDEAAIAVSGIEAALAFEGASLGSAARLEAACAPALFALRPSACPARALNLLFPSASADAPLVASRRALASLPLAIFPRRTVDGQRVVLSASHACAELTWTDGTWRISSVDAPSSAAKTRLSEHFVGCTADSLVHVDAISRAIHAELALRAAAQRCAALPVRIEHGDDSLTLVVDGAPSMAVSLGAEKTCDASVYERIAVTVYDTVVGTLVAQRTSDLKCVSLSAVLGTVPVLSHEDGGMAVLRFMNHSVHVHVGVDAIRFDKYTVPHAKPSALVEAVRTWAISAACSDAQAQSGGSLRTIRASATELLFGLPQFPACLVRYTADGWRLEVCGGKPICLASPSAISAHVTDCAVAVLRARNLSVRVDDAHSIALVNWPVTSPVAFVSLDRTCASVTARGISGQSTTVPLDVSLPIVRAVDRALQNVRFAP